MNPYKKIVIEILDSHKAYWVSSGINDWNYNIAYRDAASESGQSSIIEIFAGRSIKPHRLFMQEYLKQEGGEEGAWKRIVLDIGYIGVSKLWETTVMIEREKATESLGKAYMESPMLPNDAFADGTS